MLMPFATNFIITGCQKNIIRMILSENWPKRQIDTRHAVFALILFVILFLSVEAVILHFF